MPTRNQEPDTQTFMLTKPLTLSTDWLECRFCGQSVKGGITLKDSHIGICNRCITKACILLFHMHPTTINLLLQMVQRVLSEINSLIEAGAVEPTEAFKELSTFVNTPTRLFTGE